MSPRRRGNGEGSIIQRGDGRWQASMTIEGKRVYYYGVTRKEAQQKLDRAKQQVANGMGVANDLITVEGFLQFWLREVVTPSVRPATLKAYTIRINKYLIPYLGKVKVQRLVPQQVVVFQNTLLKNGVSANTVRDTKRVLSYALKQAMVWGIVVRNVASIVTSPSFKRPTVLVPSATEIRLLLDTAETTTEAVMVTLGALLGLRSSEVRGLRWSDISLDGKWINIHHQVAAVPQGAPQFTPLKTEGSRRTLPLPDSVVGLFHRHRAAQLRDRMEVAPIWQDYDLVVCTKEGLTISCGMMLERFRNHCRRIGLRDYRFHSLRHACASILAAEGVPVKTAMEILGHTDPEMTQGIYTHSYPEAKTQAVEVLGALLKDVG